MCGIAGIFHLDPRAEADRSLLAGMTDILAHRGPDDSGLYVDGRIGLGHRRLSIIDLRTGQQPMSSNDRTVWLVLNGEIYNFKELRRELRSFGHAFRTRSDTEVVIQAYNQWGTGFLGKMNGMFALALWDCSRSRLVLARDRLGIKPLYTTVAGNALLFASEIKSLLRYPGVRREPDPESISAYLGFRCPLGDKTLFKKIEKLSPGHMLVAENGYLSKISYWELPLDGKRKDRGEEYYVKKIRSLLKRSVRRRMISDVPIGAYLSGGLDSSIIVSLMAGMSRSPVKTYTIGFEEEGYNERRYARLAADMYGTDHREILLGDDDYTSLIPELIRFKDAPLSVANEIPLYVMSRELKKDITVVLSGEGADELFAGYGRIFRSPFDYERALFLETDTEILPQYRETLLSRVEDIYGTRSFLNELVHFMKKYRWMSPADKGIFLSQPLLDSINGDERALGYFASQMKDAMHLNHYEKLLYIFQKTHLENLLMRVDMTTMAASVEARVPFVDHELVEFVFTMPFHYKIRWKSDLHKLMAAFLASDEISEKFDTPKYILRRSFSSDLPEEILTRRKMGFPVPLDRWMGGGYALFMREILLDGRTRRRGMFNIGSVEKQLGRAEEHDHGTALKLWMLMNLELWFREYIDKPEGGKVSAGRGPELAAAV